jgi:hypothetical protein
LKLELVRASLGLGIAGLWGVDVVERRARPGHDDQREREPGRNAQRRTGTSESLAQ